MMNGQPKTKKLRRGITGDELPKFILLDNLKYQKKKKVGRPPKKRGLHEKKKVPIEYIAVDHAGNKIVYEDMYKIFVEQPSRINFLDVETPPVVELPDDIDIEERPQDAPQDAPQSTCPTPGALVPVASSSKLPDESVIERPQDATRSTCPTPDALVPVPSSSSPKSSILLSPTILNISNIKNFFFYESANNIESLKQEVLAFVEEAQPVETPQLTNPAVDEESLVRLSQVSPTQSSQPRVTEESRVTEEPRVTEESSQPHPRRQPPHLVQRVAQFFPESGIVSEDEDGNVLYWEKGGQPVFLLEELGEEVDIPQELRNYGIELGPRKGKERAPQFKEDLIPRQLPQNAKLPHSCFIFGGMFRRTVRKSTIRERTVKQVVISKTPHVFTNATSLKSYLRNQYNKYPYYLFDFNGIDRCYCKPRQ